MNRARWGRAVRWSGPWGGVRAFARMYGHRMGKLYGVHDELPSLSKQQVVALHPGEVLGDAGPGGADNVSDVLVAD